MGVLKRTIYDVCKRVEMEISEERKNDSGKCIYGKRDVQSTQQNAKEEVCVKH